jgi:hypothetical protein
MLWGREGQIVLLEVYDFEPESSHRVPDVSSLCTWEELGLRDLERQPRTGEGMSRIDTSLAKHRDYTPTPPVGFRV